MERTSIASRCQRGEMIAISKAILDACLVNIVCIIAVDAWYHNEAWQFMVFPSSLGVDVTLKRT